MATYFIQNTNSAEDIEQMNNVIDKVNKVNTEATSNIGQLTELNTKAEELSNNIKQALPINTELKENIKIGQPLIQDAVSKNTELQASLEKTKEFIDGLDGSQNIPQLRLDVTALQNGLKSNQALSYEGSSISAENTLEGRTEGMGIGGRTLQNLCEKTVLNKLVSTTGNVAQIIDNGSVKSVIATNIKANTVYTVIRFGNSSRFTIGAFDNFENGSTGDVLLVNDIEGELVINKITTKNKTNLLIYFTNDIKNPDVMLLEGDWTNKKLPLFFTGLKSFGEKEKVESGYKITILSHGKNLFNKFESEEGLLNVSTGGIHKINTSYSSGYIKVEKGKSYVISGKGEIRTYYGVFYNLAKQYISQKEFKKNVPITFNEDGYFRFSYSSEKDTENIPANYIMFEEDVKSNVYEDYKCDKKDIFMKAPLREGDYIYENDRQVKIYRDVDQYTFTGNESILTEPSRLDNLLKFIMQTPISIKENGVVICNNFVNGDDGVKNSIRLATNNQIVFNIEKSKLTTPDINGFKKWLKANTTTMVYQLDTPTTEVVENCVDIDLDTYQEKTYFNILNSLPGTLDFKVPSNIASMVQNTAKEVNNIWDVINNLLVPSIVKANGNIAMIKIK